MRTVYLRRRLVALGVFALFVLGVVKLASGDEEAPHRRAAPGAAPASEVDRMGLRALVGEVILMRFDGTTPPAYVDRIMRERRATGVTLFAENVASPQQVRALTRRLQAAARGGALVAADQEGGVARRFPWASEAGEPELSSPSVAEASASATAKELADLGVRLNFAPVADVPTGSGSAVSARAFPGDSGDVADLTAASVRGYRDSGVAPTVKHFPGFGRASENTDDAPVTIDASRDELAADLAPFRAAIGAGVPAVMVSHALYPAYDPDAIASQSRPIVGDLLRGELGFDGVVATDSMEAEAVLARSSVDEAAVRAIDAGCDLLVLTGRGSVVPVYDRLLHEAQRSPEFRSRLEQSAARVLALKRQLGLRAR
jgi:beta-N-acetylhexosaminidase